MKKKIVSIIMCATVLIGVAVPAGAAYISAYVSSVTATSCPDTRTVQISWEAVEDAESYQLQISRSCYDWRKVDSYTTTGTKYSATFNYKSAYRVVDYSECDTYYVRVRAIVNDSSTVWCCPIKTKIIEREPVEITVKFDPEAYLNAAKTLQNLYRPRWD